MKRATSSRSSSGSSVLRQRGEAAEVGEQDGDLPALAGLRAARARRRRLCGRRAALGDRRQQALAMAERGDAELLQIRVGELRQHVEIDVVVGKARAYCPSPNFSSQSKTCCIAAALQRSAAMNLGLRSAY